MWEKTHRKLNEKAFFSFDLGQPSPWISFMGNATLEKHPKSSDVYFHTEDISQTLIHL